MNQLKNGADYRASLKDGRSVFLHGARVQDVETEPGLRIGVDWTAQTYDRLAASEEERALLQRVPKDAGQLRARVELLETFDILSKVSAQVFMALLTAGDRLGSAHAVYQDRIRKYYDFVTARNLRATECITDAKGDRMLPPLRQADQDAYVRVISRSSEGVVVRGAKLHITGAPYCHELVVMPTKKMQEGEEDYSIACAVPVNAPGVKIIATTHAPTEEDDRHHPLTRHESSADGFVIFDDVFVPNERVFLDGDFANAATFAHSLGLWERLGGLTELIKQAELIVGLAQLIAEANGTEAVSHVREKLSEMIVHATMLRAGYDAALMHCTLTNGLATPNELFTNAAKYQGAMQHAVMVRSLHDIAGGSVATAPTIADLENPDTGHLLDKYMKGSKRHSGQARLRLFHAIRDFTADRYGGWRMVTNLQSGGGLLAQRLVTRKHFNMDAMRAEAIRHFALEDVVK